MLTVHAMRSVDVSISWHNIEFLFLNLYHSLFIYVLIGIATHHWVQHFKIGDSEGPVSLLRQEIFVLNFVQSFGICT
jgi:hypothetical protein